MIWIDRCNYVAKIFFGLQIKIIYLKLFIKYMVSNRCKIVVKEELKKLGLHYIVVDLGEVEIMENLTAEQREQVKTALLSSGLELMDDKKSIIIEKIKNTIIELVHHLDNQNKTIISEVISKKLNYDYILICFYNSEFKR
jgi:hypothetical protein